MRARRSYSSEDDLSAAEEESEGWATHSSEVAQTAAEAAEGCAASS